MLYETLEWFKDLLPPIMVFNNGRLFKLFIMEWPTYKVHYQCGDRRNLDE